MKKSFSLIALLVVCASSQAQVRATHEVRVLDAAGAALASGFILDEVGEYRDYELEPTSVEVPNMVQAGGPYAYFSGWFPADSPVLRAACDYMNNPMKSPRMTIAVTEITRDGAATGRSYNFFECWPCRYTFPGSLAIQNRVPGVKGGTCTPNPLSNKPGGVARQAFHDMSRPIIQNIRARIAGVNTGGVKTISDLTVSVADVWTRKVDRYPVTFSELTFTMPPEAAGDFFSWYAEVQKTGKSERPCVLEYQLRDGRTATLDLGMVGIRGLTSSVADGLAINAKLYVVGPIKWSAPEV